MATARTSKVYTISLPPDLAMKAEAHAKRESRTMSELFRESFRAYDRQQSEATLPETSQRASTYNPYNPMGYTEEDIPRLTKEVRAEMDAEKKSRKAG